MALLYIYLGGVALRAYLVHAALMSPAATKWNLDVQMLGCIFWPLSVIAVCFTKFK